MNSLRHQTHSATSASSYTTDSSAANQAQNNSSETVLMATRLSNISLAEQEERRQYLDRLELLKTVGSLENEIFLLNHHQ